MTRFRIPAAACVAAALLTVAAIANAQAGPQLPKLGRFSKALLAGAASGRAVRLPSAAGPADRWCVVPDPVSPPRSELARVTVLNGDNLGTHYARGNTLVIIVFVNDNQFTWTPAEMAAKGALARQAKDYYLANAPAAANLSFDNQGTMNYYFYEVTSPRVVGYRGMTTTLTDSLLVLLGFDDDDGDGGSGDEATLYLQTWNGGWDNVILAFAPHSNSNGRNWARQKYSVCSLYFDAPYATWAHEWGHLFGACDEDNTACGSSACNVVCPFADEYRDAAVLNGNCPDPCGPGLPCLMADPHSVTRICDFTLDGWGWNDEDANGVLDTHKRRVSGSTFVDIIELSRGTPVTANNVANGYVYAQKRTNWAVAGVRSPAGADYNLTLYADDNHNFPYASSGLPGTAVDFVVGDYNHSRVGNEHVQIARASGTPSNYRLQWESGSETLQFTAGSAHAYDLVWPSTGVVDVHDILIDGGVTGGRDVAIEVMDLSGSMDLGLALFKSSGAEYFAARANAVADADAQGVGGTETIAYHASTTDCYGLVVFNRNDSGGDYRITVHDAGIVGVGDEEPQPLSLLSSPNPASGPSSIRFNLPRSGLAKVAIYDIEGRVVRLLVNEERPAGEQTVTWEGRDNQGRPVGAGVYFARLRLGGEECLRKFARTR
jgi:hypothetical protein